MSNFFPRKHGTYHNNLLEAEELEYNSGSLSSSELMSSIKYTGVPSSSIGWQVLFDITEAERQVDGRHCVGLEIRLVSGRSNKTVPVGGSRGTTDRTLKE